MKKPGILIAVFLLLLLCITAASAYAFVDTQTISQAENRTLAKRPVLSEETWLDGSFASGMDRFLSDHVFRRSTLVGTAQRLEKLMERKTSIKLVSHNASDMAGNAAASTESAQPDAQQSDDASQQTGGGVQIGQPAAEEAASQQDRLVLEDRIVQLFQDSPENLSYYAKVANSFYAMFPDRVNKICLLAPCRIAFETPEVAAYGDDEKAAIQFVYDKLDPLVTTVDAYSALEARSGRLDDLYYRLDHHWTHLGAYYAAEAMFQTLGISYTPLTEYERKEGNPFLGYFYAQDPDPQLESHKDELIYYLPKGHDVPKSVLYVPDADGNLEPENAITVNPMRGGYYTFAGSSFAYIVMEGANPEGGCLLMAADSYGNAFGTWLAENYSRVIQIDPRDYTAGKAGVMALAEEYDVTDVLLCDYLGAVDTPFFPSQIAHLTE